ncbi:MAG: glycosyltransferase family 9 protein [Candidatus Omnitrophica bacterium]|nr:glycosyltransferase family 9 protein [Candidatus Omnitrophota bacterium]
MYEIRKILFVTLTNIGDVILTLPVLDTLRVNFPEAEITVICGPRPVEIFENDSAVKRVIAYDKHAPLYLKWRLLRLMRQEKFDVVVDLRNSFFGWLVRARYKTSPLAGIPARVAHMRDRHLYKLKSLADILPRDRTQLMERSLEPYQADRLYIEEFLAKAGVKHLDRVVVVSAGARSIIKRWPKEKFAALIRQLTQEFAVKVILIGDRDDAAVNQDISRSVGLAVADLSAQTTLLQVAALLRRSALLITNDSANSHLASYLGVPVVTVFGPTDDVKYGPWSNQSRLVKSGIGCRPCRKAVCRFNTLACLQAVEVEDVVRASRDLLKKP